MEKLLYSKKGKGIVLIIHNVSIVIAAACITVIGLFASLSVSRIYGNYRYGLNLFKNNSKFEDTDLCYYLLSDSIDEIIRYTVIREQMESNGVFDGNKPIDIEEYAKRYQFGTNKSDVYYRLEDLIKWGQYGLEYDSEITYGFNESGVSTSGAELVERYRPKNGKSIKNFVSNEKTYEELCGYLSESISSLSYNYYQYRQFQNIYNENKTNIRYYIVTDGGHGRTVYSNLPSEMNVEEAKEYIKKIGKYVSYDANTLSFDTNMGIHEEELTYMLNEYEYAYSDDCQVLIGLDTNYPINDAFAIGKGDFYAIVPWLVPLVITTVICICLAFVCFIYMTIVTGKNEYRGEVLLNWFDAIHTESALFIAVFLCGSIICTTGLVSSWCFYNETGKISILVSVLVGVLITHLLFQYFYLSLIRRIKNKTLWKNSVSIKLVKIIRFLCIKIFHLLQSVFFKLCDNGRVTTRTWIPYVTFLVINLSFILLFKRMGVAFGIVFDFMVGGYLFNENKAKQKIVDGIEYIKNGDMSYQINTASMHGDTLIMAEAVNTLGDAVRNAVETSMKDERLKADLITNVSHDIKTPLTSIINYVDLIKRENIQNEKVKGYISILDSKSQRLKHLTEDLVEASKISSGNISLQLVRMNLIELLYQTTGEFTENFNKKGMRIIMNVPDHPVVIEADSRCIWRVIENLFRNIEKYAMENTRIYIDLTEEVKQMDTLVHLSIKNISKRPLNINAEDLTERFIRGDISRGTEGSGLGLSIAKNLMQLQNGSFQIYLDGDLFKVILTFFEILD